MDSTQFRHVGCMCINCEFYSFMSTHQEQYYHKSVEATQEELVIAQKMLYSHLYLGDEMLWDQSNPVLLTIGTSTIWYLIGSDSILITTETNKPCWGMQNVHANAAGSLAALTLRAPKPFIQATMIVGFMMSTNIFGLGSARLRDGDTSLGQGHYKPLCTQYFCMDLCSSQAQHIWQALESMTNAIGLLLTERIQKFLFC